MRWLFLQICLLSLSGCVNYAGIHGNATPFTSITLNTPITKLLQTTASAKDWWVAFHDTTLNSYIALGLQDSPSMQLAENRVSEACYLAQQTNANRLPSVDATAYYTRERFSETGIVPPPFNGGTFNIADVAPINFNYEFDFWGKNQQRYAASVSQLAAARANQDEARVVLSTGIAYKYFQLANNLAQIQLLRQTLQTQQAILAINTLRHHHGLDSAIPVTTTISDLETLKSSIIQYQQAADLDRHQLAALMGQNPFTMSIKVHPMSYHHYQIRLPTYLPANLLAKRPDILAARDQAEAAAHTVNAAKARFFPTINLIGLFSYQTIFFGQLFKPGSQNNAAEAVIDLPLFDANQRRANFGASYAAYDAAVNQYNQTILTALQEVADQNTSMRTLYHQIQTQRAVLQATRDHYQLVKTNYRHGITNYVNVLALKQEWLQQKTVAVNLETAHLQAVITMIKALGGQPLVS